MCLFRYADYAHTYCSFSQFRLLLLDEVQRYASMFTMSTQEGYQKQKKRLCNAVCYTYLVMSMSQILRTLKSCGYRPYGGTWS